VQYRVRGISNNANLAIPYRVYL